MGRSSARRTIARDGGARLSITCNRASHGVTASGTSAAAPLTNDIDAADGREPIDVPAAIGDSSTMRSCLLLTLAVVVGCGDDAAPAPDAGPPARQVVLATTVDGSGLSSAVEFVIPEHTRSVTIVIEGDRAGLYALGALALGDGIDRVALPAGDPGAAMQGSYRDEQIGQMPGDLYQSIRLGTFTQVYPYRPGQAVVPGPASLRVASDTAAPVRVTIVMPADDGARTLPINVYIVSDTLVDPTTAPFVAEVERIFAQAGITVVVAHVERIGGTALERLTESTEPQEAPGSQAAMLPALVADRDRDGLDLFFVESLPSGIGGLALGTPGPPLRGSYYFGVIVRGGLPAVTAARVVAHEGAHFLALQHVQNVGVSGASYPDPLDDTRPGQGNLMENGTVLTADQTFALAQSALLITP